MIKIEKIQKDALMCYQCSKCNSVCPAFRVGQFSPREFILKVSNDGPGVAARDTTIWGCMTCGMCDLCPMEIDIPSIVIETRALALDLGNVPVETKKGHRSLFTLAQKIQGASVETVHSNAWPRKDQSWVEKGKIALFPGAMAYWPHLLYNYDLDYHLGLQAILEGLNSLEITPAIPTGLRDSGHDLLYGGEKEAFLQLARKNVEILNGSNAEKIIVANPEDYHVLKNIYPEEFDEFNFDVLFWTEYLVENGFLETLEYQIYLGIDINVAYHDPCKLGRINGIYDSPRILLEKVPRVVLKSLDNEREWAPCCGVTGFIGCNEKSLFLRKERLNEVIAAGADVLVSTCPACVLHYQCAHESMLLDEIERKPLEIMELSSFLGKYLFKFNSKK